MPTPTIPLTLSNAMLRVENQLQGERSLVSDNPRKIDIWKDLRRVFRGKELNEQIILRCEGFGVNCSKVRASLGFKPKPKEKFSYDSACETLAMCILEPLSGHIPDERYNNAIKELAQEVQHSIDDWLASHAEFDAP